MTHKTRLIGVLVLVAVAVLDSLAQQGVLDPELRALILDITAYALPALGLGAAADAIAVERRRRDPSVSALSDDVRGDS
jgi:hypothetical protein